MDPASDQIRALLEALSRSGQRLNAMVYADYLRLGDGAWGQASGLGTTASPFEINHERFDRALTLRSWLRPDKARQSALVFALIVAWTHDGWFVQASVEEEDPEREEITRVLWESPAFRSNDVGAAIASLDRALGELESCRTREPVASYLAKPRSNTSGN